MNGASWRKAYGGTLGDSDGRAASRTQLWLQRVHNHRVNTKTIHRVFRDIGVPLLTKTSKRSRDS